MEEVSLKPKKNSKRSPKITRWLIRSFSEFKNPRKVSISSGSLPVKWVSETKIQSFCVSVNWNPSPSYTAVMETQTLHMRGIIDISEVDEDRVFQ